MLRDYACTACPLGASALHRPINVCLMPEKLDPCDIMIVAEAPTHIDDKANRVFYSKMLRDIKEFFQETGLKVHCAYASKCSRPKDVKISDKLIKTCRDNFLVKEIERCKPKHIITLGSMALKGAVKKGDLTAKRGSPLTDPKWDFTVYPTLHQAQAAYSEENRIQMWDDLKLFRDWIQYGFKAVAQFDPPVFVVDTIKGLKRLEKKIYKSGGIAACDIETQGLNPFDPESDIRCIQFCWDTDVGGVFVPMLMEDDCYYTEKTERHGKFWPDRETFEQAMAIIRRILRKTKLIWHNGKFDRVWLHAWGDRVLGAPLLCPKIYCDTMHLAFLLNENRSLGLKKLITSVLKQPTYDIADKLTKDLDLLIPYATKDTVACLLLAHKFLAELCSEGMEKLRNLYIHVIKKADALYTKMELEGWPISERRAKKNMNRLIALEESKLENLAVILYKVHGIEDISPKVFASPQKLSKLIFEELGFEPSTDKQIARTESGGLSTDNDALIHLRDSKFIHALLEWRGVAKALSTYALPMYRAAKTRGKLTTSYKLAKVVTGRTASGKEGKGKSAVGMNLQNLPPTFSLKKAIMCEPETDEDFDDPWWILECDFSQIELRIAGQLSKDEALIENYQRNGDLHTFRAMRVLRVTQKEWDKMDPKEKKLARNRAKPVNFGFLYGMSWHKFKQFALTDYGVIFTDRESQALRDDYFKAHKGLPKFYAKQERQAVRLGYVESLSGRRRHLPNIHLNPDNGKDAKRKRQEAVRMAINTPVQGFGSDLKIMALIEIDSVIDSTFARLFGEVHDSIVLRVRRSQIKNVAQQILGIMRHPKLLDVLGIELDVPIEAEAECGPSLGEKAEINQWNEDWELKAA